MAKETGKTKLSNLGMGNEPTPEVPKKTGGFEVSGSGVDPKAGVIYELEGRGGYYIKVVTGNKGFKGAPVIAYQKGFLQDNGTIIWSETNKMAPDLFKKWIKTKGVK